MLIRRYHSFDFIGTLEISEFTEFCIYAREKDIEDRLYIQWCAMLPQFAEYMGFGEFKEVMTGKNVDMRPAEVIIREIEELHREKGKEYGAGNF